MIGLGSNRLSVCRRGGMRVTQAGRGGMEWLAGGRRPSWASPYSAQATAALKDAFTAAQWATIRQYGFAHPEIVGYMNAYAPEDAKIAYSLVPTLGKDRWCIGNGSAYIETGCTIQTGDYCKIKVVQQSNSQYWSFFGQGSSYSASDAFIYATTRSTQVNCYIGGRIDFGNAINVVLNTPMLFEGDHTVVKVTNLATGVQSQVSSGASSIASTTKTAKLFRGDGSASNLNVPRNWKIGYAEIGNKRKMIPFIHKDNGTDKYGMIDLLTGTFYGDATGNNGFTISETPTS